MRATHSLKILAFVTLAAAGSAALAQLPEGVQTGRNGTEVMLTGQATLTQTNNEAVVNLYCTEIGADAADVARKVIEATNTGLTELKKLGLDARYETTQLSSWPHYSDTVKTARTKTAAPKITGWQVRQNVQITVKDAESAAKIAQVAQKYFAFESVNFSLSREAQEAMQGTLTRMAIENAAKKAVEAAKALGKTASDVRIESLSFNGSGNYYAPRMLRASAVMDAAAGKASAALPVFEAGDTSVTMTVQAKAVIR